MPCLPLNKSNKKFIPIMKRLFIILIFIATQHWGIAQTPSTISLGQCYQLAKQNYPLINQYELVSKSASYAMENASKAWMPQVSVNAQATYQSEVTEIPIKLPGLQIPAMSKDQYKVYAEVTQTVYDGGAVKSQKDIITANAQVDQKKNEVELKKINERINQLYFGVLLVNEQLKQLDISQKDIEAAIAKTNAAISQGIALKSNNDALQVELLRMDQRRVEFKATRKAYLDMLGLFLNQTLNETTIFQRPDFPSTISSTAINRPELMLIEQQQKAVMLQTKMLDVRNRPKVGVFLQAGMGRPALNMLNNDFSPYYIGGVRINWALNGFYTVKNDRAILNINQSSLSIQKDLFLFNTQYAMRQQQAELEKYQALFKSDDAIITLRTKIKNTSLVQLENGVITSSDYLREQNAEQLARETKSVHELQFLLLQYNLQYTLGN